MPCFSPEISGGWLLRLDPTDISNSTWLFKTLLLRLLCLEDEIVKFRRLLGLLNWPGDIINTIEMTRWYQDWLRGYLPEDISILLFKTISVSLNPSPTCLEYHPHFESCCILFHTHTPDSLSYSSKLNDFSNRFYSSPPCQLLHSKNFSIFRILSWEESTVVTFSKFPYFWPRLTSLEILGISLLRFCCCYQLDSFTVTELVMIISSDIFFSPQ